MLSSQPLFYIARAVESKGGKIITGVTVSEIHSQSRGAIADLRLDKEKAQALNLGLITSYLA